MRDEKNLPDDENLEIIRICGPTEAQMIEEVLLNNGIDCTLQGDVAPTPLPAAGELDEVRIWVRHNDAAPARELVEAFFSPVGKDEPAEGQPDPGVENTGEPGSFTE